jgi:hypothetical protein
MPLASSSRGQKRRAASRDHDNGDASSLRSRSIKAPRTTGGSTPRVRDAQAKPKLKYRALDTTKQEIRVLTLHPGSDDSTIACSLRHRLLADPAPFVALSYCWGAADTTKPIVIDRVRLEIQSNLWAVLKQLRRMCDSSDIWADAICINQDNPAERGHQVRLTREIYTNASTVCAWLGHCNNLTESAFHYIQYLADRRHRKSIKSQRRPRKGPGLRAVASIFRAEYWTRLWIIQELALASFVVIMMGHCLATWEDLVGVYPAKLRLESFEDNPGRRAFIAIQSAKGEISSDMATLVSSFHRSKCHDRRHIIYGLLGLTSSEVHGDIVIDYTAPVSRICIDNMHHLVSRSEVRDMQSARVVLERVLGGEEQCLAAVEEALLDVQQVSSNTSVLSIPTAINFAGSQCFISAACKSPDHKWVPLTSK